MLNIPYNDKEQANYSALRYLVENYPIRSYLEIGVQEGGSLSIVLNSIVINRVCLCDTWGGNYGGTNRKNHAHIDKIIYQKHSFYGKVTYLDGDSKILIPKVDEKFDLIYIDGDHSYDGAMADLENVKNKLNPNGFIVFDDITHPNHKYLKQCTLEFSKNNSRLKCIELHEKYNFGVVIWTI